MWVGHRRTTRLVVGFAVQALWDSLEYLSEMVPAHAPLAERAARCRELGAAILQVVRD